MTKRIFVIAACGFLAACASNQEHIVAKPEATTINSPGAKSLFSGDNGVTEDTGNLGSEAEKTVSKKPIHKSNNKNDYSGLSYWIERQSDEGMQRVTTSSTFTSGNRVRLHVKSNRSGYLYVVNQGSSGHSDFLFPATSNDREYIDANQTYTVPAHGGYIRFDSQPGQEVVWIFLSQYPLSPNAPAQNTIMPNNSPMKMANYNPCGGKDLLIEAPGNLQSSCGMGSKDLVVEDDSAPQASPTSITPLAPAEYVVGPTELMNKGQILSLRVVLRHE